MKNLGSVLKSRDITLSTEVHIVKAVVFPVVTYGCESWTIRKAECQSIDAFELLGTAPDSHLDIKEINQSILKKINPECPLEALMLKLNLQYFGYLM